MHCETGHYPAEKSIFFFENVKIHFLLKAKNFRSVTRYVYLHILFNTVIESVSSHFRKRKWTFQQDSVPFHNAKITQKFCEKNLPSLITKNEWPPCFSNLNPKDFTVWGYLEKMACKKPHKNIEDLKKSFIKEWARIPKKVLRASVEDVNRRLKATIEKMGAMLNKSLGN